MPRGCTPPRASDLQGASRAGDHCSGPRPRSQCHLTVMEKLVVELSSVDEPLYESVTV